MQDRFMCDAARKAAADLFSAAASYGPDTPPDHMINTMMVVATQLLTARGRVLGPGDPMADVLNVLQDNPWNKRPPGGTIIDGLQRAVAAQEAMERDRKEYATYQQAAWDHGAAAMSFGDWQRDKAPALPVTGPGSYIEYLRMAREYGVKVMNIDDWERARLNSAIEWGPDTETTSMEPDLSTTDEPGPAPSTDATETASPMPSETYNADEHNPECVRQYWAVTNQQEHWSALFPRHCPHCDGWGFINTYTHKPSNLNAYATEDYVTKCPRCLMVSQCPRCGHHIANGDGVHMSACLFCAWTPGMHGKAGEPVCICRHSEAGDDPAS